MNKAIYQNFQLVFSDDEGNVWSNEPIPETDSTPHINVGAQFQCRIPSFMSEPDRYYREKKQDFLLWDPGIQKNTDNEGKNCDVSLMCLEIFFFGHI